MPEGFAGDRPIVSGFSGSTCAIDSCIRPNFVDSIRSVHTSLISVVRPTGLRLSLMVATMLGRSKPMRGEQLSSCSAAIRYSGFGITTC